MAEKTETKEMVTDIDPTQAKEKVIQDLANK